MFFQDLINQTKGKKVHFIGIGGIGMSSICRYLMSINIQIYGYDKTETSLTQSLVKEGATISYVDEITSFPDLIIDNISNFRT